MATPVETIADALFSFILSLLRDPVAAKAFTAEPQTTLANHGLGNVCQADVAAVKPVIVDHPSVVYVPSPAPAPQPVYHPTPSAPPEHHDAVREIVRMVQHFTTIDARSTIVDQSVNQNIWTNGGDVTQTFDQSAVIASGDHAVAAGDDATIVDSQVDITTGDITAGNTTNTDSYNTTGADPVPAETSEPTVVYETVYDPAEVGDAVGGAVEAAHATAADAPVPEPADVLEGDMTASAGDTYEADTASAAAIDDGTLDTPLEDD